MCKLYKVRKLKYCTVVRMCVKYFDSIHVRFNHSCSFLPMQCVYKCVDELLNLVAIATIHL